MMPQSKQKTSLAIALLLALSGIQAQAQSLPTPDPIVFNAPPPPPSTGRPGRRSDAGSRGCGEESASASEPLPLMALVPTQAVENSTMVFGTTAAERPTFWFFVPSRPSSTAIFVLQDQDGNTIYEAPVTLPQTAGVLSLALPATAAPLEVGEPYHWFFKLYCRSTSPPDSFVDGWIQREPLTTDLTTQLQTATPQQRARLYAANGFWFDALTMAAELHQTSLEDAAWAELLRAIGLENLSAEAINTP